MKQLLTEPIKQYYFVKNEVIFDINGSNLSDDECGKAWSAVTLPYVTVQKGSNTATTKYYLDTYIQVGDKYKTVEGAETFMKAIHKGNVVYTGTTEAESSFTEYYKALCEYDIKTDIEANFKMKNSDIVAKKGTLFHVPAWMIKGNGYTVTGITQINITENYVATKKKEIVQEAAYKAASDAVKYYNYNMTSPGKASDITVAPK
jgi:hypothetical protein